ncbi:ATP-grasp fold domain-containing protein [Daldinia bambusicola]|nr:ATP-grasp fold domain-containing protein [Daldinia bambusicola]
MEFQKVSSRYPAGAFSFEIDVADKRAHLYCHWRLNRSISTENGTASADYSRALPCSTLDLLFTPITVWPLDQALAPLHLASNGCLTNGHTPQNAESTWTESSETGVCLRFIQNAIKKNIESYGPSITAIKLLLPNTSGYAVRSDIIQRRFLTYQLAESVADFTTVGKKIRAFDCNAEITLLQALDVAAGAIHLKYLPGVERTLVEYSMTLLEDDVKARLSFPWIVERPLPRKRLALVDGKAYPDVSTAPLGIYRAAKALGIELVVVDHDGHWTQDSSAKQWRDEFIACDITIDEGLPDRIANALSKSKGPIHCITTFSDKLLPATARAAEKMGLFTSPSEAMDICHDKRKTREFTSSASHITVNGLTDLRKKIARLTSPLLYPLIVKPAIGYCSDGVARVSCETELFDAVRRIEERFPGIETIVEPYVLGPEVDANFFLFDGELLWSEINDDFPSSGDISQTTAGSGKCNDQTHDIAPSPPNSFAELSTIMPSLLPEDETSLLTSSLTETLLKLGFKNGLFHLEARVKDSKMEYSTTDKGVELVHARKNPEETLDPSVFLIEINPRVPGHQEVFAVEYTYGIDYFALHMLAALSPRTPSKSTQSEDDTALRTIISSLCEPLPPQCRYPSHVVFVPLSRGGTFMGAKPLPEELERYVVESQVFLEKGEVLEDPKKEGKWPFVAYFVVVAKLTGPEGRAQARMMGELVRAAFEYVMD